MPRPMRGRNEKSKDFKGSMIKIIKRKLKTMGNRNNNFLSISFNIRRSCSNCS